MTRHRPWWPWLKAIPVLLLLALVAVPVVTASPASAGNAEGWTIQYVDRTYDAETNTTTFTWQLVAPSGQEEETVSHILIDTCLGDTAVSTSPTADEYRGEENPNPPTGTTGYKWESPEPAAGDTFSITFAGNIPEGGSADWTVKKGAPPGEPDFVTGTANGPSCVPVPEPGSLTVEKVIDGITPSVADVQLFHFTVEELQEEFDLADGGSKTFSDIPAGVYTITEDELTGWTLVDVTGADSWSDLTATVTVPEGGEAVVTFHNEPAPEGPSLTVVKDVVGGEDPQDFAFEVWNSDYSGDAVLDDDSTSDTPNSKNFDDIWAGGSFNITETAVEGWTLAKVEVDGVEADVVDNTVTVEVPEEAYEPIVVTFYNEPEVVPPTQSLTVVKDVVGGENAQDFTFGVSELQSQFVLDDDSTSAATPQSKTFSDIPAGTYTVSEDAVTGWTLTSVDGGTLVGNTATVVVAEGEDVTATFHNTPPAPAVGDVRITKDVIGLDTAAASAYTFTFEVDATDDAFDHTVAKANALTVTGEGSVTLTGIPVGTVLNISEVAVTETGATWTTTIDHPQVTVVVGLTDVKVTNGRTAVLGEQVTRTPTELPRTGAPISAELWLASLLVLIGASTLVTGKLLVRRMH